MTFNRLSRLAVATAVSIMLTFCGTAPATAASSSNSIKLCKTASAVMQQFHTDFSTGTPLSKAFAAMEQSDLSEHPAEFVSFVLLTTPKIWLLRDTDYAKIQPVLYKQCLQHMQQTTT